MDGYRPENSRNIWIARYFCLSGRRKIRACVAESMPTGERYTAVGDAPSTRGIFGGRPRPRCPVSFLRTSAVAGPGSSEASASGAARGPCDAEDCKRGEDPSWLDLSRCTWLRCRLAEPSGNRSSSSSSSWRSIVVCLTKRFSNSIVKETGRDRPNEKRAITHRQITHRFVYT